MPYKDLVIKPNNVSNQRSSRQSQFYKGFYSGDTTSLSNKVYDTNLVHQDIMNMFQTRRGERVMNPEFGTVIWELLYDPFTDETKQKISDDVTRILNYDPRVTPSQINITEAPYGLIIEATLNYTQLDLVESMKLSFDRDIGLRVE
jgi:phage baseplate assembly protein W